jgi:hypothetical protein
MLTVSRKQIDLFLRLYLNVPEKTQILWFWCNSGVIAYKINNKWRKIKFRELLNELIAIL